MKKFAAAVVAAVVLTSVAAPAFAQTIQNCVFKDKALCVVETLSNTKQDD